MTQRSSPNENQEFGSEPGGSASNPDWLALDAIPASSAEQSGSLSRDSRPEFGLPSSLEIGSEPVPFALAEAPTTSCATPFIWQHGQQLLLLDHEPLGWILAELHFDSRLCHYVEIRRATYRWPREAAGSLLARLVSASTEEATGINLERTAQDLLRWIASHRESVPHPIEDDLPAA